MQCGGKEQYVKKTVVFFFFWGLLQIAGNKLHVKTYEANVTHRIIPIPFFEKCWPLEKVGFDFVVLYHKETNMSRLKGRKGVMALWRQK